MYYFVLLTFRDYVEICNFSVDGFTYMLAIFVAPLYDAYVSDTGVQAKHIIIIRIFGYLPFTVCLVSWYPRCITLFIQHI